MSGPMQPRPRRYPFLLGTTSYIIAADIVPNARFLAPRVDDIELVLFESDAVSNIPSASVMGELAAIAQCNGCGYTVHLPTDARCGCADEPQRRRYRDNALRVIERTRPLAPRAYIVHCEGVERGAAPAEVCAWQERCIPTIEALAAQCGDPHFLAVENLGYPMEWNAAIRRVCHTSACLDVGHLWVQGVERWEAHCRDVLAQTSVIHLHGVRDSRDHCSLAVMEEGPIRLFLDLLRTECYTGVVTLEIFSERDFGESVSVVEELWER